MGPCDLSTIVPKSTAIVFPHLKLIRLLCRHHICSPQLKDSPRGSPMSSELKIIAYFSQLMLLVELKVMVSNWVTMTYLIQFDTSSRVPPKP